jgi:hypothetical protein
MSVSSLYRLVSASWFRASLVLSLMTYALSSLSVISPVAEAAQLEESTLTPQQSVTPIQLADYANQLAITLDGRSMLVEPQEGGWSLDMRLESVAWNGVDHAIVGQSNITTTSIYFNEPPSYTSKWDLGNPEFSFQEYYHSMSLGVLRTNRFVEETFDPDSQATFPVTLTYQLTSELVPQITDAGRGVRFLDDNGFARLNYQMLSYGNNLIVSDEIRFQLNGQQLLVIADPGPNDYFHDDIFPLGVFQRGYIKAPNPQAAEGLGVDMALSGDTLAVSAYHNSSNATGIDGNQLDTSAPSSGAVFLYERLGLRDWQLEHFIKASNTDANDEFGYSIALDGDTLVVGAPGEASVATSVNGNQQDNSAANSGAVYVFVRDIDGKWNQQAYLKGSQSATNHRFGSSVALQGDTIVIGAPSYKGNPATMVGTAYIFTRSGTTWSEQAVLQDSNATLGDWYGISVAIEDGWIAVAAPNRNPEIIQLFKRNSTGQWQQQAQITAPLSAQGSLFGYAMDFDQGKLAVGAPHGDSVAYLFEPNAAGTWLEIAQIELENAKDASSFGMSVDLDGDRLLVGAPEMGYWTPPNQPLTIGYPDTNSSAYLFTRTDAGWKRQIDFTPGDNWGGIFSLYGWSVILEDGDLLISALSDDTVSAGIQALNSYGEEFSLSIQDSGAFYNYYLPSGLEVSHQGQTIAPINGKLTSANGLDLGAKPVGQAVDYTFSISNTALSTLNFIGTPSITISGTHASDFAIVNQPSGQLARGAGRQFELRFTPSGEGLREAEIQIASDDLITPAYRFVVKGLGYTPSAPTEGKIVLFGKGTKIAAGASTPQASDNTDFGQQLLGTSRTMSYTIVNSGSQPLALTAVTLSGPNASQFSIVKQPKASLAAGESTTFEIAFTPSAVGAYSATVTIGSDDPVAPAYTFAIAGEAVEQTTATYQIYLPLVISK